MRAEKLETRVMKRIDRKRGDVFLRADFSDLGGYDQVGRALRLLVNKGKLLKLGQGIYTRAAESPFDGTPAPVKGLRALAKEALGRLGVESAPTRFEQSYIAGQTTQVPAGRVIAVRKRVRRKIGYKGIFMSFEGSGSAATATRKGTAHTILALAKKHGVAYTKTAGDTWAQNVTRLADDDVTLDAIELLLIELQRTGHLSRPEALRLQANYLREAKP